MRGGLLPELWGLVLATLSVTFALVPHIQTNRRVVLLVAGTLGIAITLFSYYLEAYTGRGLFDRAACAVFSEGAYCPQHQTNPSPNQRASATANPGAAEVAAIAAERLEGRWHSADDPSCAAPFTLVASGGSLSFTGLDTTPFREDIVAVEPGGAVRTDIGGTQGVYELDGALLLFSYGPGVAPVRFSRCAS